jgi:signal transduction histidine kinase
MLNIISATLFLVYITISIVDIYLFLDLRKAIIISIPLSFLSLFSLIKIHDYISINDLIIGFVQGLAALSFFAAAAHLARKEKEMRKKIGFLYDELKISRDKLQKSNDKLKDYSKKIEDITLINERNRLASEIHDTIGHKLTALLMEIDLCQKLVDLDTAKCKVELSKAQGLARETFAEVRRSVKDIKPENSLNLTGINAIKDLIRDFEKNTRIKVDFQVLGQQYKITPTMEVTIYKIIQEALTNSAKHGKAKVVNINLNFKENIMELAIMDDGVGSEIINKGIGLQTMEERVNFLGGEVSFSGIDNFSINVKLPIGVVNNG